MTRPVCTLLQDVQNLPVVGIGVGAGQAKQYYARRRGQPSSEGQGTEILVMGNYQAIFLGCSAQNRVVRCRPHGFLDGYSVVTTVSQFTDDCCTDILIGDNAHLGRQAGSE